MKLINDLTVNDANDHNYIHPIQFIEMVNAHLDPWRIMDFEFKNAKSGKMVLHVDLVDRRKQGATRIDPVTGMKEEVRGIRVDFPLNKVLPTKDEINILIESVKQDLGLKGSPKIYMGK